MNDDEIERKPANQDVTKDLLGSNGSSAGKEGGKEAQEREKAFAGGSGAGWEEAKGDENGFLSEDSKNDRNDDEESDSDSGDGASAEDAQNKDEDLEKLLGAGKVPEISVDLPLEFERQPDVDREPCTNCNQIHSIFDKQCEVAHRLFEKIRTKINEQQYCDFEVYVLVPNLNSVRWHYSCILRCINV